MSGQQRDVMFCHECEEEWYRDERGLTCPSCQSDFTEIIEPGHDPRDEQEEIIEEPHQIPQHPLHNHNPWADTDEHAPDPDEEDISNGQWRRTGPNNFNMTFRRNLTAGDLLGGGQGGQNAMGGMAGPLANIFQNILGGGIPMGPGAQQQSQQQQQQYQQATPDRGMPGGVDQTQSESGRESNQGNQGTFVRSGGGQGFQWRVQTSFNAGPGNLRPRDASSPQPQGEQFDDINNILSMMFGGHPAAGIQRGQRGAFGEMGPFSGLMDLFNPANMQHGDAVYSQEALDRIVSQLMEQNGSGNAPGPATAEAIASLPKRKINEKDLGPEGKADCSICMDEAKIGEEVTELPCHHWFHGECVNAWLSEHDTCPHCRQGIMPKDGPADATRTRRPDEAPRHDQMWGQGEGTRENPWVIPDSPTRPTASGSGTGSAGQGQSAEPTDNATLFGRMRNAFGGGN